jgi:hypothetical protein
MLARPTPVLRFRASPVAKQQAGPNAPKVNTPPGLALRSAILNAVKEKYTSYPERPQPREDGSLSSQQIKYYADFAKAWMGRKVFIPVGQQTLRDVDQVFMALHLVERQPFLPKEDKELFSSFKSKFLNTVREELPNYNAPEFPAYPLDETVSAIGTKYHPADVLSFVKQRLQEERKDPSKDILDQQKRNLRAEWTNLIEPAYRRKLRNPHEYLLRMGYTIKDIEEIEKQTLPQPSFNRRFPQSPFKYPTDFLQKRNIEVRQKNDYEKFGFPNLTKSAEELEQQYATQNVKSFEQTAKESQPREATPDQKNTAAKLRSQAESILLSKLSEAEKAEYNRLKSNEEGADAEAWGKYQQKLMNIGLTLASLPARNQWSTYDIIYDAQLLVKGQWEHTLLAQDPTLAAHKDQFIQLARQAQQEWADFEAAGGRVTMAMLLNPAQVDARATTVGPKSSSRPQPPPQQQQQQQQQQQPPRGPQQQQKK